VKNQCRNIQSLVTAMDAGYCGYFLTEFLIRSRVLIKTDQRVKFIGLKIQGRKTSVLFVSFRNFGKHLVLSWNCQVSRSVDRRKTRPVYLFETR